MEKDLQWSPLTADVIDPNFQRLSIPKKINLLVVDDSPHDIVQTKKFLARVPHTDYQLVHASTLGEAANQLDAQEFDIVLLDFHLGNENGLEFFSILRNKNIDLPVVLVSEYESIDLDMQSLSAGCLEYLPKSLINTASLERTIRYCINNHKVFRQLTHLASHDDLTGLANRNLVLDRITHAILLAHRHQRRSALLYVDIDDFKLINDNYGHDVGDAVLKNLSQSILQTIRKSDSAGRLGGDEFVIVLEDVLPEGAELVAKKLIESCRLQAEIPELSGKGYSCSVGIAYFPHETYTNDMAYAQADAALDAHAVIKIADDALYEAKNNAKGSFKVQFV